MLASSTINLWSVQPECDLCLLKHIGKVKVKWFRYRPGVAQRVGRGIALLFRDRGTGKVWVVSSTPWPHFTPGKDPVPILQEAEWAPGPVWTGAENLAPPPGFDPRTVQPVASRYADWAIVAHIVIVLIHYFSIYISFSGFTYTIFYAQNSFIEAFTKFRKATVSLAMSVCLSVCPSVRKKQLGSH